MEMKKADKQEVASLINPMCVSDISWTSED